MRREKIQRSRILDQGKKVEAKLRRLNGDDNLLLDTLPLSELGLNSSHGSE